VAALVEAAGAVGMGKGLSTFFVCRKFHTAARSVSIGEDNGHTGLS
jgi:hypothetical protein